MNLCLDTNTVLALAARTPGVDPDVSEHDIEVSRSLKRENTNNPTPAEIRSGLIMALLQAKQKGVSITFVLPRTVLDEVDRIRARGGRLSSKNDEDLRSVVRDLQAMGRVDEQVRDDNNVRAAVRQHLHSVDVNARWARTLSKHEWIHWLETPSSTLSDVQIYLCAAAHGAAIITSDGDFLSLDSCHFPDRISHPPIIRTTELRSHGISLSLFHSKISQNRAQAPTR